MTKVKDEMTAEVVTVEPNATALEAAKKMKASNVGTVIVIDNRNNKKPLGVVTDRELTTNVLADQKDPTRTRIQELMHDSPQTVRQDTEICEALETMAGHSLRRAPVVDENERVIGVLSASDVAKDHAKECDRCSENILDITSTYV